MASWTMTRDPERDGAGRLERPAARDREAG